MAAESTKLFWIIIHGTEGEELAPLFPPNRPTRDGAIASLLGVLAGTLPG